MFKVSLLPDSYRRQLDNKVKMEFFLKVVFIILACLAILLGGVAIKGSILKSKLNDVKDKNDVLQAQFPALQEYQQIYNDLQTAQKMIKSVSPKQTEAVEFLTKVSNITPDYVQVTQVEMTNWNAEGTCTLTCQVQDYKDVQDYKALFETEQMKEIIKTVQVTSIKRSVDGDKNKTVTFTLVLSMSSAQQPTQAPQYENSGNQTTAAQSSDNKSDNQTTQATTKASKETTTAATSTTAAASTTAATTTTKKGA